jgi:hypothetical protein
MSHSMTRRERDDLAKLMRQRERVAKSGASARSAHLMAEFEAQLDRRYSYDEDAVWEAAALAAKEVVARAQSQIAERCRELGIPPEFAPGLSVGWYARGRNSVQAERGEMRRIAKRRIEEIEAAARLEIERASIAAQEHLLVGGLTSIAARAYVDSLPSIEALMPSLDVAQIQLVLSAPKPLAVRPGMGEISDESADG